MFGTQWVSRLIERLTSRSCKPEAPAPAPEDRSKIITPDKQIILFLHCPRCIEELHSGNVCNHSPESYARLSIGSTPYGIQVWCVRHDINVAHIDFEGHKHPANTSPERGLSNDTVH